MFDRLSHLSIAALWSPAGKGLISWLSFVMLNCVFFTFPCGFLSHVWQLVVSIPDLCRLSYFVAKEHYFDAQFKKKRSDAIMIIVKVVKCLKEGFFMIFKCRIKFH